MSKKLIIIFLCLLILRLASLASTSFFDPAEFGKGARPLGLGNAYVGLGDDASVLFLNPAGLGTISDRQATSMYSTLFGDIRYLVLGIAEPFPSGNFGFGYIDVYSPPTAIYEIINGRLVYIGESTQSNRVILLSYAKPVQDNLFFGGNLKYFNFALTGGGSTYEASGTGLDIDLGLKFLPRQWLSLGLSLKNTLPASMGGKFNWSDGTSEGIPARFIVGTAFRLVGKDGLREDKSKELNFTSDYEFSRSGTSATRFGVEFWPVYAFGLRAGIDSNRLAFGAGFKNKGVTFDYAYNVMQGVGNVSHSFSLGYIGEEKEQDFTSLSKEEVKPNEYKLKYFSDVPEGYFAREQISKLVALDIMSGYPDNTFKPDEQMSRAELALILVRALNIKSPKVNGRFIKDLPPDYWAAPYAKAALKQGLMTGYADDTFRPNWPIKRAEAVVILGRFDKFPEKVFQNVAYADVPISYWAEPSVSIAKEQGMLGFIKGDMFDPEHKITRGQLAYMLYYTNFFKKKSKEVIWK